MQKARRSNFWVSWLIWGEGLLVFMICPGKNSGLYDCLREESGWGTRGGKKARDTLGFWHCTLVVVFAEPQQCVSPSSPTRALQVCTLHICFLHGVFSKSTHACFPSFCSSLLSGQPSGLSHWPYTSNGNPLYFPHPQGTWWCGAHILLSVVTPVWGVLMTFNGHGRGILLSIP
jgi:hypothetical protein